MTALSIREALKPCPFCGGTRLESGGDDKFVGVRCLDCDATGPNHYITGKQWNTRAAPPQDAVEGIARIIDPDAFNDQNLMDDLTPSERHYIKINQPAKRATATAKATAILASRLVTVTHPDEAAIRADEREKCALVVERWSLPTIQTPSMWLIDKAGIAAAIRAGGAK